MPGKRSRGHWRHLAMAGALVNGVTLSAFHVGMVTENIAVMALIQSLSPILIALSAVPLPGERLRPSQWLGLVLGTVGVALVVAPRALEVRPDGGRSRWGSSGSPAWPEARSTSMLTHGTAGRVAANFYLFSGTVALVGWAFLDEALTRLAVLGFVIASSGVFLVARSARDRSA